MPATPIRLCLIKKDPPTSHQRLVVRVCGFPMLITLPFPVSLCFPDPVMGRGKGTVTCHHVALSMPITKQFVSSP